MTVLMSKEVFMTLKGEKRYFLIPSEYSSKWLIYAYEQEEKRHFNPPFATELDFCTFCRKHYLPPLVTNF